MTEKEGGDRRSNHLAGETSPYLLQHAHDPVIWYPWGPEAIGKARREGKPIFLSIGYAACHWCHVMKRESFEDERVAAFLGEHFVAIKVDREERPDIDEIYMTAVHAMTGTGGWPLSVFLTPDLDPFFGGTYFPPEDREGRPGFPTVLDEVRRIWAERREDVTASAGKLAEHLRDLAAGDARQVARPPVGLREIARAAADLTGRFDAEWGGFGGAPKFPPHGAVGLLLREHLRSREPMPIRMVETTLDRMALGGMYDQIGGGFARYSTDRQWLVPHFEKMLYDQALLVPAYLDAWLVMRKPLYRRVVEETLEFVRRELTAPEGGFLSSLDADTEGHEGAFYVFTPEEIANALGPESAAFFCGVYGIGPEGNFEGRSVPNLLGGSFEERAREMGVSENDLVRRLAPLRSRLLAERAKRARPATDDKVLAAWNGLTITAFARAHQAFGNPEYLSAARRAADFALAHLVVDGRLKLTWCRGSARLDALLDDHAFLARGLLDLYETGFERRDLDEAARIARAMQARFEDTVHGGFFSTPHDHEPLPARLRSVHDGALPAGCGVAAETLLRLDRHLDDPAMRKAARRALLASGPVLERAPAAHAALLAAADFVEGPVLEIAIAGAIRDEATRAFLEAVRGQYIPNRVVGLNRPGDPEFLRGLLAGKKLLDGKPTAYVCRGEVCHAPVTDPGKLSNLL